MRIVVPITEWKSKYNAYIWMIHIPHTSSNGLTKDSAADASQVKAVSIKRFVEKIGYLSKIELDNTVTAIALCVGYSP